MSPLNITAIYEHGTLRLPQELPLQNGQKVNITIHFGTTTTKRRRKVIEWNGSLENLDYLIMSDDNNVLAAP